MHFPIALSALLRHAGKRALLVLLVLAAAGATGTVRAQQAPPLVMATHQPDSNFQGQWVRRIYAEAFRRLGIPMEVRIIPLQRLTEMLLRGEIDGDVGRLHSHGQTYPDLVRVDESMYEIVFGLYAIDPTLHLKRIEDLAARPLRAVYVRGVAVCERLLKPYIAPEDLSSLVIDEQGMEMLALGRAHVFCTANHSIADLSSRERYRGLPPPRLVWPLSDGTMPLYAYLNRRHAALAPRLAAVLREMRIAGVIERLRLESLAATRQ